jgi:hypothetical protein
MAIDVHAPCTPRDEIPVLHKCANPDCANAFRKLTQGKLFLVETDKLNTLPEPANWKHQSQRRIEYYWLCDQCAPQFTLAYERGRGVVTIALAGTSVKKPATAEFRQLSLGEEMKDEHRYAKGA